MNTHAERMDVVELPANDIGNENTIVDSMQNQKGHAIEVINLPYHFPNFVSDLLFIVNSSHIVIKHSYIKFLVKFYSTAIIMRVLA